MIPSEELDAYIRNVASQHAAENYRFVGRYMLPDLCEPFLPDEVRFSDGQRYSKDEILERLDELLSDPDGLARDLDMVVKGNTMIEYAFPPPESLVEEHVDFDSAGDKGSRIRRDDGKGPMVEEGAWWKDVAVFPVSSVLGHRAHYEYRLKWKGYESTDEYDHEWIPEEDFVGCKELLAEYWKSKPEQDPKPPKQTSTTTNDTPTNDTPTHDTQTPSLPSDDDSSSTSPARGSLMVPFKMQHLILNRLQSMLEHSCYHFIRFAELDGLWPSLASKWPTPESAELDTYTREIVATYPGTESDHLAIEKLNQIRDTAVHRTPVSEARLLELLEFGEKGAAVLGDSDTVNRVRRLRETVNRRLKGRGEAEDLQELLREKLEMLEIQKRGLESEIRYIGSSIEMATQRVWKQTRGDVERLLVVEDVDPEQELEEELFGIGEWRKEREKLASWCAIIQRAQEMLGKTRKREMNLGQWLERVASRTVASRTVAEPRHRSDIDSW
ncbi:hypothetical protein K440DRAFT_632539 [Wilcoxina mikolae CBS 423.85]|nr:hypothetical protein K440DRAFT_632539 [Wilcoxina mikolae CBS 423.85]